MITPTFQTLSTQRQIERFIEANAPCTARQIADEFALSISEVNHHTTCLRNNGRIRRATVDGHRRIHWAIGRDELLGAQAADGKPKCVVVSQWELHMVRDPLALPADFFRR